MVGFILAIVVSLLSANLLFTRGFDSIFLIIVTFFIGFIITKIFGHVGFGGGSNADQQIYIDFLFIAFAIMIPFV